MFSVGGRWHLTASCEAGVGLIYYYLLKTPPKNINQQKYSYIYIYTYIYVYIHKHAYVIPYKGNVGIVILSFHGGVLKQMVGSGFREA